MSGVPPAQFFIPQAPQHYGYQGVAEVQQMQKPAEEGVATLLIRHLPEAIPNETLHRLFSYYGASSVRACTSGRLRNCAFVDFTNEALALQALRQLNGLRFLGKVLSVERASRPTENSKNQCEAQAKKESTSSTSDAPIGRGPSSEPKIGSLPGSEPIAERLGVDYPFPPHLEYAYPPPDGNILTNILNALIAVPRFYTQVLHLMNKMNIPAPFRMALPTPPLPPSVPEPLPPPPPPPLPPAIPESTNFSYLSSGESEMESSEEEAGSTEHSKGVLKTVRRKRKRNKREDIVGPAVDKDVDHEAVGLKQATLTAKEIPMIKKNNPVLQIKIAPRQIQNDEKDDSASKLESEENNSNPKLCATLEELENGKLPPEEILSLPMFKNYTAGNPTNVLYIKNLSKDVVADDFYYIFGAFFESIAGAKSNLSIKLMQEGRMRGQAFLTFPSIEIAHHALNVVNGYVYKGKPMIIQFGRNASAAK